MEDEVAMHAGGAAAELTQKLDSLRTTLSAGDRRELDRMIWSVLQPVDRARLAGTSDLFTDDEVGLLDSLEREFPQ